MFHHQGDFYIFTNNHYQVSMSYVIIIYYVFNLKDKVTDYMEEENECTL